MNMQNFIWVFNVGQMVRFGVSGSGIKVAKQGRLDHNRILCEPQHVISINVAF